MDSLWIGLIAAGAVLVVFVAVVIVCCIWCKKCRSCCQRTQDDVENQAATLQETGAQNVSSVSGLENPAFPHVPVHVPPGTATGHEVRQTILDETISIFQRTSLDTDERGRSIQLQRLEGNTLEQLRLDQQRLELRRLREDTIHQQRLKQVRVEQSLVQERLEQQRLEQHRLEQQRLEEQRLEQQRLEQQRLEQQRLEQQRLEQQRLAQQRLEQQRLEQQRLEQQRLEQQRLEQQRLEQQRLEQQRLEQQRLEQQRLEQERVEAEQRKLQQNVRQIYVEPSTFYVGYDDEGDDDEDEDEDEEDHYDDRWENRRRGRSRERNLDKIRHRSESGDYSRQREVTDPEKTIDLHYMSVHEAMYSFTQFLENMENEYHYSNYRRVNRFVHVITGRGLHSRNRIPKIKPEVQNYLDRYNYDHEWKNNGGLVTIDLLSKRRNYM